MSAPADIARPVMRYHGGKFKLAPWLIANFPPHDAYVEAFGGAASVLMLKPRVHGEVYNDLDGDVVGVFRVLRDPEKAEQLRRRLTLTPFARDEYIAAAVDRPEDPVEVAALTIIRSFMGFGSDAIARQQVGFRSSTRRDMGTRASPAVEWATYPEEIPLFVERLAGVTIENRDALEVMRQHDAPNTLHYVDPPYVHATRSSLNRRRGKRSHGYRHEMTDAQHRLLIRGLRKLEGMVVLSGYPSDLYDRLLRDWRQLDRPHMADGARPRLERIWLNPAAARAQRQQSLL